MSDPLARVKQAAARRDQAAREYRAAVLAAYADGKGEPFAEIARAAGVSRQSVRELVNRVR